MSEQTSAQPPEEPAPEPSRIAFERLRERTDELELILSGILSFALLALPRWLFDGWARGSAHAEGVGQMLVWLGYVFASGFCYALAIAFLCHLAVRGYWVGLIGLKASFSRGIRWDSIGTMGPISRDYYRQRLPDLMAAIDRADRLGSIIFAMAILFALLLGWAALVVAVAMTLGLLLDAWLDLGEAGLLAGFGIIYGLFMLVSLLLVVLDVGLAKRRPALAQSPRYVRFVRGVIRLSGVFLPQRLILPVQLSLQSNLSGKLFMAVLMVVMAVAPMIGAVHVLASRNFAMFSGYSVLDDKTLDTGLLSAHYENLRDEHDRLLRYPMIDSDRINGAYLRLFLPHLPERDNPVLAKRCPGLGTAGADIPAPERTAARTACVAGLWTVTLAGEPVDLSGFMASERRDLGLRGLQGYLPMAGLAAGRHDLFLVWNAEGEDSGRSRRREYLVPFWLSPGFDQSLEDSAAPTLP